MKYELMTVGKLIKNLTLHNQDINICLREELFDDGVTDKLMTIQEIIEHLKRLSNDIQIIVSRWWNYEGVRFLKIVKV